ncbi:g5564 [Coccomyxa viridis]|uniref:G5564 protein n=1 Tax=Coccomyxa viridis TaxID=1274662 RepID=A0ABP1FY95_9CHLO
MNPSEIKLPVYTDQHSKAHIVARSGFPHLWVQAPVPVAGRGVVAMPDKQAHPARQLGCLSSRIRHFCMLPEASAKRMHSEDSFT